MSSQNVLNKKFSFGSGPKPAVDRINKYFRESNSISRALHNLLDRFDGESKTEKEKLIARERFSNYCPIYNDVCEISKTILQGKQADNLQSIKESFTRFSRVLSDTGAYTLLSEKEAPVLFLEHVLSIKPPTKKEKLIDILGLVKQPCLSDRKMGGCPPRPPKKVKEMLQCKECSKKSSSTNGLSNGNSNMSSRPISNNIISSARCLVCQNQLSFIPNLPLNLTHRLKKDVEETSDRKHNTAMPGSTSVYKELLKQFNLMSRNRNNARKRKQPPEGRKGDAKRNRTGPGSVKNTVHERVEYMKSVRVKLSRVQPTGI